MAERTYHEQVNIENEQKLREKLKEFPDFCKDFFRGIEANTSSRTRISYAYDLGIFFDFLKETNPETTVITKEAQTIKATTSKTFNASKLKKKALTFKIAGKASSGNKVTYKLVKSNKHIKFNAKTGVVTIKKGTKKGTYKIKVKMSVKGNSKYKSYSATKTITIKVRK